MLIQYYYMRIVNIIRIYIYKIIYKGYINIPLNVSFRSNLNIIIQKGGHLEIGNNCFFNNYCSINCLGKIVIGDNTIFGENVKMYDHNHKYNDREVLIRDQGFSIGQISIGKNCWIASNVTILNNVTIGDNVVIGANCLILKSIPSNSIVKSKSALAIESVL